MTNDEYADYISSTDDCCREILQQCEWMRMDVYVLYEQLEGKGVSPYHVDYLQGRIETIEGAIRTLQAFYDVG